MELTAAYSSSGAYPASVTTMDGTTSTAYNESMDRLEITYDAYARTQYNYTSGKLDYSVVKNDLKTAAQVGKVDYKYTWEQLTQIVSPGATYDFSYDAYGNRLTTKVGGNTLMTNSYQALNGQLTLSCLLYTSIPPIICQSVIVSPKMVTEIKTAIKGSI